MNIENDKIYIPPIKSQGIKTKLIPLIKDIIPDDFDGRWIEPFMGTGTVGFNINANSGILCDTNPHLINFYNDISSELITTDTVRKYLEYEGKILLDHGDSHYYFIRDRFNSDHSSFDFLFLNRAGFNGMIRFNRKGGLNVPFCKKPQRFSKSYITKIVNQVDNISKIIKRNKITFKYQPFNITITESFDNDIIYCDPPYIDRYSDYYNGWNETNEYELFEKLSSFGGKFILSTWHHNKYRENKYIKSLWCDYNIIIKEHFYHIGGNEENRNSMVEALITNYEIY